MLRKKKTGGSIIIAVLAILILIYSPGLQAAETGGLIFKDIAATDADLAYIKYLANQDIIKGYPDGKFQPQTGLTRAQAAVVMVKAGKISLDQNAPSPFKDLKKDHWARAYVATAVKAGYISGYPDGTFKPDQPLSRAQGISLLLKLSKQPQTAVLPALKDISAQHWAAKAVAVGLASGMVGLSTDGQNYYPDGPFTRINMAHALGILLTEDPTLYASSLPGKLKAVQGQTTIVRSGSQTEEELKETSTVNPGDSIITAKGASAELSYPDGSSMLIKEDSRVSVKEAKGRKYIKTNGQEGIAIDWLNLDMKQGTMFTALATKHEGSETATPEKKTSKLNGTTIAALNGLEYIAAAASGSNAEMPWYEANKTKKVKVKVDMPWGVAAVRGTFVMISVAPSGQASVSCLTGTAEVSNGGQTVPLGQNQATQVTTQAAPPPPPAPMTPAAVQQFAQVQTWIEQTAQTMDQVQEQAPPPPPVALAAPVQQAPVQQTVAPTQPTVQSPVVQTPSNPVPALSALQAVSQALSTIGLTPSTVPGAPPPTTPAAPPAPTTSSNNSGSSGGSGSTAVAVTDYSTPGTYGPAADENRTPLGGNVNITCSGVTLQNTIISGNLTLTAGIGTGSVTLKNVKVLGSTSIQGGGPDSIHLEDSELYTVSVDNQTNTVRIVAKGSSTIGALTLNSGAKLEENDLTGAGFSTVSTGPSIPVGATIILSGNFAAVNLSSPGLNVQVAGGSIDQLNIAAGAGTTTTINLAAGIRVSSLQANAGVSISGSGQILNAVINVSGVQMSRMPDNISFGSSGSAVIAGQSLESSLMGGSTGSLAGRVLDASGTGISGAMIFIHMVNTTQSSPINTTTAAGGGFLLSGIAPGTYIMEVMPAAGTIAQMPTTVSDLTVTAGTIKIVPDITVNSIPPIQAGPQLNGLSLTDMVGNNIALTEMPSPPIGTSPVTDYYAPVTVGADIGEVRITPVVPTGTTLLINGEIFSGTSKIISLNNGPNSISLTLTADNTSLSRCYSISIIRGTLQPPQPADQSGAVVTVSAGIVSITQAKDANGQLLSGSRMVTIYEIPDWAPVSSPIPGLPINDCLQTIPAVFADGAATLPVPGFLNLPAIYNLAARIDGVTMPSPFIYTANGWNPIGGAAISAGGVSRIALPDFSRPYLALEQNNQIQLNQLSSSWSSMETISNTQQPIIDGVGYTYLAYRDATSGAIKMKKTSGSTWSEIANSPGNGSDLSLSVGTSNPYVAYIDTSSGNLMCKVYNTAWSTLGTATMPATAPSLKISNYTNPSGQKIDIPYLAATSQGSTNVYIYYSDNTWRALGAPISVNSSANSLAVYNGVPIIACNQDNVISVWMGRGEQGWYQLGQFSGTKPVLKMSGSGTIFLSYIRSGGTAALMRYTYLGKRDNVPYYAWIGGQVHGGTVTDTSLAMAMDGGNVSLAYGNDSDVSVVGYNDLLSGVTFSKVINDNIVSGSLLGITKDMEYSLDHSSFIAGPASGNTVTGINPETIDPGLGIIVRFKQSPERMVRIFASIPAPLLSNNDYSSPVTGSAPGKVKIDTLNSSYTWWVKVQNTSGSAPAYNSLVDTSLFTEYTAGSDLPVSGTISAGQHILLLAVDANQRIKGYADIVNTVTSLGAVKIMRDNDSNTLVLQNVGADLEYTLEASDNTGSTITNWSTGTAGDITVSNDGYYVVVREAASPLNTRCLGYINSAIRNNIVRTSLNNIYVECSNVFAYNGITNTIDISQLKVGLSDLDESQAKVYVANAASSAFASSGAINPLGNIISVSNLGNENLSKVTITDLTAFTAGNDIGVTVHYYGTNGSEGSNSGDDVWFLPSGPVTVNAMIDEDNEEYESYDYVDTANAGNAAIVINRAKDFTVAGDRVWILAHDEAPIVYDATNYIYSSVQLIDDRITPTDSTITNFAPLAGQYVDVAIENCGVDYASSTGNISIPASFGQIPAAPTTVQVEATPGINPAGFINAASKTAVTVTANFSECQSGRVYFSLSNGATTPIIITTDTTVNGAVYAQVSWDTSGASFNTVDTLTLRAYLENSTNKNRGPAATNNSIKYDTMKINTDLEDVVFPANQTVSPSSPVTINSSEDATNTVWFAPSGTTCFIEGSTMTKAGGTVTSIPAPSATGTYNLYVLDEAGNPSNASAATLTVN